MMKDREHLQDHRRNAKTAKLCDTKTIVLFTAFLICLLLMITFWVIEEEAPAYRTLSPTVQPTTKKEHYLISLPPHLQDRRKEFWNNSFIQMLHQHNLAVHATNCWVCGLLPHATEHSIPFIPSPFSVHGSCLAWLMLLQESYRDNATSDRTIAQFYDEFWRNKAGKTTAPFCPHTFNATYQLDVPSKERVEMQVFNNPNRATFSFLRKRTAATLTVALSVVNVPGLVCIKGCGTKNVGYSTCNITRTLNTTNPPALVASPNMYFVCGTKAYTWLPRNWGGTCYIAFVLPPTYTAHAEHHRERRSKDTDLTDSASSQFLDAAKGFIPLWGPMVNSRDIRHLSQAVETALNITAGILTNNTAELQAVRLVALQNRMVLDVVLADRGGACRIIGASCCIYIPDNAPSVYEAIEHLHKLSSEIHQGQDTWTIGSWFWDILKEWGWKISMFFLIPILVICGCCLGIHCVPPLCSLCITALRPKTLDTQLIKMRVMYDREIQNIMEIEID